MKISWHQAVGGVAVTRRYALAAGRRLWQLFPASHYLLLALLFVVGLELIFALQRWVIVVAVASASVVGVGVVLVRLEEQGQFRPLYIILPVLAAIGFSGFAFLLPTTPILHLYVVAAGLLFFWLLKHGVRQAYPLWNWTLSLPVYFFTLAFVLGLRFHLDLPVLGMLLLVAALTSLVSLQALARIAPTLTSVMLPVLAMTFALAEVTWVLQFLPVHHLVQAGVVTALYYVMFSLVSISYMRKVTRRDIVEYVTIGMIASLIILMSAQWT
jgi:hypothetical protein